METFDSLAQYTHLDPPLNFSMNGFSYTASAANGFYNVGPTGDTWLSLDHSTDTILFSFTSNNVTAVGGYFFGTDLEGAPASAIVTITLNDGSSFSHTVTTSTSFIGFTTLVPISSITVAIANPDPTAGPYATVNDLITGIAIPPHATPTPRPHVTPVPTPTPTPHAPHPTPTPTPHPSHVTPTPTPMQPMGQPRL